MHSTVAQVGSISAKGQEDHYRIPTLRSVQENRYTRSISRTGSMTLASVMTPWATHLAKRLVRPVPEPSNETMNAWLIGSSVAAYCTIFVQISVSWGCSELAIKYGSYIQAHPQYPQIYQHQRQQTDRFHQ